MIPKEKFVREWWEIRLKAGRQVIKFYEHGTKPRSAAWHKTIDTAYLWNEFCEWMEEAYPEMLKYFNKAGFCIVFYRVTGAKKTMLRGPETRFTAAKFEDLRWHKEFAIERAAK